MKKLILFSVGLCLTGSIAMAQQETEPNNSVGQANVITLVNYAATSINNTIGTSNDVDWYVVTTTQAGVLIVNIPAGSTTFKHKVEIYDNTAPASTGKIREINDYDPINCEVIIPAGTWYIKVSCGQTISFWNINNAYDLNISLDVSDTCEFNNLLGYARDIPLNTQVHAKIRGYNANMGNWDEDYYKVHVPKCGVLQVSIPTNTTGISMRAELSDSATNTILKYGTSSTGGSPIDFEIMAEPQTYIIHVTRQSGSQGSPDPYYLTVGYDTTDKAECNDNFGSAYAMAVCDTVLATIRPVNNSDYYKVTGNGNNLTFKALNTPSNLALKVVIYDNSQSIIGGVTGSTGQDVIVPNIPTTNGQIYYAYVTEMNGQKNDNPYDFVVIDANCGTTDVSEISHLNGFAILPNPNNGQFIVRTSSTGNEVVNVCVSNMLGQVVGLAKGFTGTDMNISVDAPAGIYIVTVATETAKHTEKIIIQ